MLNFRESGHPIFRPTSALDREILRKKGGKFSIHLNGESTNAEFLLRTINSVGQLSIYGAVADWCDELAQQISADASSGIEKSIAKVNEQLDRPLALGDVKTTMKPSDINVPASRNRLRDHHDKFENLSKEKYS